MLHYRQTIELQEKHRAQGSPQMPSDRERERESLHSPLKRIEEDGQNHIVCGFKKEAYGCDKKKKFALRRREE